MGCEVHSSQYNILRPPADLPIIPTCKKCAPTENQAQNLSEEGISQLYYGGGVCVFCLFVDSGESLISDKRKPSLLAILQVLSSCVQYHLSIIL